MAYFDCIVGGSGKGNTLVVTCADDLAGATITCTNGTKTYTKTCPSTSPYEVTFYGLAAGTWTVSATVSGNTYTTTVVIADYEAELGGFNWKTWVNLSDNYTSSDFTDLDDLLSDETAVRELMTIHACVDYLADIATTSADVETIIGNDLCAKWINNRDYALDTLYANEIIADYMDEADKYFYGEWVIVDDTTTPPTWGAKGNVPIMTSNTAPYGNASNQSNQSGYEAYKAFDGNDTTYAVGSSTAGTGSGPYIAYKSSNPINVRRIYHKYTSASGTETITVKYSDDGSTWIGTNIQYTIGANEGKYVDVPDCGYHLYWGCFKVSSTASSKMYAVALQFYGRELSVSVPAMTTNTTPYGIAGGDTESTSYLAFDGDDSTAASKAGLPKNAITWYKFLTPIKVKRADFLISFASVPSSISAQVIYSDDGVTFHNATEAIAVTNSTKKSIDVDIQDSHMYWGIRRILSEAKSGTGNTIQFYGLDYSEKEFEEGTTKKWLYDHGVELEAFENFGSGAIIRESSQIGYNKTVTGDNGITTVNTIDLTDYDLLRAKVGSVITAAGNEIAVTGFTAYKVFTTNDMPNTYGFSISSINESKKILATPNASAGLGKFTISELWLE